MLQEKLNPKAAEGNTFQLTKTGVQCCPDTVRTDCEYSVVVPNANKVTALTVVSPIDGTNTTFPIGAYTTNQQLMGLLSAAASTAGYVVREKKDIAFSVGATNTTLYFRGEMVVVSVDTDAPANVPVAATLCNSATYCDFKFYTDGGATNSYIYNGTTTALGALTYGTTTAAAVRTAILGASPTATAVTVTDDVLNMQWEIRLTAPLGTLAYLNSKQAERCDCERIYVA